MDKQKANLAQLNGGKWGLFTKGFLVVGFKCYDKPTDQTVQAKAELYQLELVDTSAETFEPR